MAQHRVRMLTTSAIAIIAALSIGLGVYMIQPQLGAGTSHTSSTTSTSNCLVPVPWATWAADQQINSSFVGFVEKYPNGTEDIFPAGSCPQLVPANLYSVASAVEMNSNFTKAENGSRYYFFDLTNSSTSSVSNSSGPYSLALTNLYFYNWSRVREFVYPCGYYYYNVSEIVVNVPVNSQGYHVSNMTVSNPQLFALNGCGGGTYLP